MCPHTWAHKLPLKRKPLPRCQATIKSLSTLSSHAAAHVLPLDQHLCVTSPSSSMGSIMPHLYRLAERNIDSDTTCWGDPRKEPTPTKVHGNKPKWGSILKPIDNRRTSPLDLYTMTILFKFTMWDFFTHVWHSQQKAIWKTENMYFKWILWRKGSLLSSLYFFLDFYRDNAKTTLRQMGRKTIIETRF